MEISHELLQDLMERAYARRIAQTPAKREKVRQEPEVYLVSLLLLIEEQVIDPRKAQLTTSLVEMSGYEPRVQRAREFLEELSAATPHS